MLDTHAIARNLTNAGVPPDHADAITDAIRDAAERSDYTTCADLAALEARLTGRFAGALLAQTAVIAALIRMLG